VRVLRYLGVVTLLAVVLTACSSDDDDAAPTTSRRSTTTELSTAPGGPDTTVVDDATTTTTATTRAPATTTAATRAPTTTRSATTVAPVTTAKPVTTMKPATTVAPPPTQPPGGPADLGVSLSDLGGDAQTRQYRARIDNVGPGVARNVVIELAVPSQAEVTATQPSGGFSCTSSARNVRCTAAEVPVGGIVGGVTVTLKRDGGCAPPDVQLVATVSAATADPNSANNRAALSPFCET
jgi:hypothetical protein